MSGLGRTLVVLAGLGLALGGSVQAQSLQRFSLQGSGAVLFPTRSDPDYASRTRLGYEAQARYTFGRFSVGGGYQRSTVFAFVNSTLTRTLSFGFVEPRYVAVAGSRVALYFAGRFGAGKLICSNPIECTPPKTNLGFGGGTGLLFKLSRRLTGDLGAQFFRVQGDISSGYAMVRAGLGIGLF